MVHAVHCDDRIGAEEADACGSKDPGEAVPPGGVSLSSKLESGRSNVPARIKGNDFAISGASADRRPVIDIRRSR